MFKGVKEISVQYSVLHYYSYKFNKSVHDESVMNIYTTDDIDPIKVKNVKLRNMNINEYIYFIFEIPDPDYRIKNNFNTKISKCVENIKKQIRKKYKSKIKNYIHDIIIHVSDNEVQTKEIADIMKKYDSFKTKEYINTKLLMTKQINEDNIFTRADILVRKYSYEKYLKNNSYDFSLYKTQQSRRNVSTHNHKRFINLIQSVERNGFNSNYPILCNSMYILHDGSHRLAIAYSKNIPFVSVTTTAKITRCEGIVKYNDYGISWYEKKNFSNEELDIIRDELEILKQKLK